MKNATIKLNVLGYFENGEHVALALEMDLRGYGSTFEEALEDLNDQVAMQLSYSLHKTDSLEMAYKPAESVWHTLFAEARIDSLRSLVRDPLADYFAADIDLPEAHVIEAMRGQYALGHA